MRITEYGSMSAELAFPRIKLKEKTLKKSLSTHGALNGKVLSPIFASVLKLLDIIVAASSPGTSSFNFLPARIEVEANELGSLSKYCCVFVIR